MLVFQVLTQSNAETSNLHVDLMLNNRSSYWITSCCICQLPLPEQTHNDPCLCLFLSTDTFEHKQSVTTDIPSIKFDNIIGVMVVVPNSSHALLSRTEIRYHTHSYPHVTDEQQQSYFVTVKTKIIRGMF